VQEDKPLPREIEAALTRVRFRLRAWAVVDGLAIFLFLALLLLWAWFLWDYATEPNREIRIGALPLIVGSLLAMLFWHLVRRARRPLSNRSIALIMERHAPELADRLVTAVELAGRSEDCSPGMLRQTTREVVTLLRDQDFRGIIRRRGVLTRMSLSTLLVLTLVGFVLLNPVVAGTWLRRVVLFEPERYPRYTHLDVVGFEGKSRKVARGRDAEVAVAADAEMSVPEKVEVKFWMLQSETDGSQYMTKIGANRFRFVFKSVLEPIEFEVRGGDDRTERFQLLVVEPPLLREIKIRATYPEYTHLPDKVTRYGVAALSVIRGTTVAIDLVANKPIAKLWVKSGEQAIPATRLTESSFQIVQTITQDLPLAIDFEDTDGITLADPFRMEIIAAADQPPEVVARLRGISGAITPVATVPIELEISDDFGLGRVTTETKVDETASSETIPFDAGERSLETRINVEVSKLKLTPGQRMLLSIAAEDTDTIDGPHTGRSVEFPFEIVTEEELLSRLATRELNLRQRFEQIVRELSDSRARLVELEASLQAGGAGGNDNYPAREADLLGMERRLKELRKSTTETAGVHEDFRDILSELVNNRAGTSTLLERIEQGIVTPLDSILKNEFPATDLRLQELRGAVGTSQVSGSYVAALEAEDQLIARANEILQGMLKLESFNEAIAMLRKIIDEQQTLLEKTKEQRKQQVLDLLK
jgi:hypothetical protein